MLRFIEELHGLKPMTDRDAQASPLAGAFDFTQPPRLDPRTSATAPAHPRETVAALGLVALLPLLVAAETRVVTVTTCEGGAR